MKAGMQTITSHVHDLCSIPCCIGHHEVLSISADAVSTCTSDFIYLPTFATAVVTERYKADVIPTYIINILWCLAKLGLRGW